MSFIKTFLRLGGFYQGQNQDIPQDIEIINVDTLTNAESLDGTEEVPLLNGQKATTQDIANLGGNDGVESITAGTNITLGGTATNPIINATGGSSYLVAEKTLTDAQFKALPSGDFIILTDLAVGQFPLIIGVLAYWNFSAAGYTNIDSTNGYLALINNKTGQVGLESTYIRYGAGMSVFGLGQQKFLTMSMSGLLDTTNNTFYGLVATQSVANISGSGIRLRMGSGLGNLTGGNAANTFTIKVVYTSVTL